MWKAEIDYCKQIEMPETKNGGCVWGESVSMNFWVYLKPNLPIFNPDFLLPCAQAQKHINLLSLLSVTH